MKIFITGATGYIGTHLVKSLARQGHSITAFARKTSRHKELKELGINFRFGDITNRESIECQVQDDFDMIVHLAFSLFPDSKPSVNINGIKNIISVFQNRKIKRFVFVSSALVYGPTAQNRAIKEDFSCKPNMTFARQELLAENLFLNAFKTYNMPVVIIRPSEIFGGVGGYFKEEYLKGIIDGKIPIIGKGTNNMSMSYVGDVVQAIIKSLEIDGIEGEVFNINTPDVITVNKLVEYITNKANIKKPMRIPKPLALVVASIAMVIAKIIRKKPFLNYDIVRVATLTSGIRDISKAKDILGFKPKYNRIMEGIENCYFYNSDIGKQI